MRVEACVRIDHEACCSRCSAVRSHADKPVSRADMAHRETASERVAFSAMMRYQRIKNYRHEGQAPSEHREFP